mmetsp:Transcript_51696/g.143127  ORF Transcript_51696/g.143127 Transcript_51696/m.143127 type:complete len:247 (-) Transcript_51696:63-803(-)
MPPLPVPPITSQRCRAGGESSGSALGAGRAWAGAGTSVGAACSLATAWTRCSKACSRFTTAASALRRAGSACRKLSPQLKARKLSALKRSAATLRSTPHEASCGVFSGKVVRAAQALGSSSRAAASCHASSRAGSLHTRSRKADITHTMPGATAGEPRTAHPMSYCDSNLPEHPSTARKRPPAQPTYKVPSLLTMGSLKAGARQKSSYVLPGQEFLRTGGIVRDHRTCGTSSSMPTSLPTQRSPEQ